MKRWRIAIPVFALGLLWALAPGLARAQQEAAPEPSQSSRLFVVPDLSAALPLEQINGLQSLVAAGLNAHLDKLLPSSQAKNPSVDPKAVSAYLAQNITSLAPQSYSGSLLVESLADVSVARRAAASLGARPEHRGVAQRLLGLAEALHQDAAGWKAKLQRLQIVRRQTFCSAGNSQATAACLLNLFDGANAAGSSDIPATTAALPQASTVSGAAAPPAAFMLEMSPAASRDLRKIPRQDQDTIRPRIAALGHEPRPHGVKKLTDQDSLYRIRVGHWRVIYRIDDKTDAVIVLNVLRRSKDTYSAL